jgi:hypothetical protein
MHKSLLCLAAALASCVGGAGEIFSGGGLPSQASSGLRTYYVTSTGGYTLGAIDWSGYATTRHNDTWGSELLCDISGPFGSGQLLLGTGTTYAPGASFTGSSQLFSEMGDPAGTWTFDFYEGYDDGADGWPDATWSSIQFTFNDYVGGGKAYALEERFEGGIPATWSVVDNIGGSLFNWELNTVAGRGNETGGSGACASADADTYNNPPSPYDVSLISESFVIPANALLEFDARHKPFNNSTFEVILHADSGDETLLSDTVGFGSTRYQFSISSYAGESATVEFRYAGDDWDFYAQVDNVVVVPEPTSLILLALALVVRRR